MSTLQEQIAALTAEQAIEAAQFVSDALAPQPNDDATAKRALGAIVESPYQHLRTVEELARIILVAASEVPDYEAIVADAVAGVSRKQVVLGGAEIVALAVIGLLALQVIVSGGKTEERSEVKIEVDPQTGKPAITTRTERKYGLSSSLTGILTKYFGR